MGFKLIESWESSLGLVVKKICADLMSVMNKLHHSNPWIGLTEQVRASLQNCVIVTDKLKYSCPLSVRRARV